MFSDLVAIITFTGIYAMVALGLNIQWGMTGLINLGQVAFFAVGSYTAGLALLAGAPFFVALIAAAFLAGAFGIIVALLTPRLREDYLAIVTLGVSEVVRLVLLNENWIANGPNGIGGIPQPLFVRFHNHYDMVFAEITIFVVLILLMISLRIARFPLGRVFQSIREDELVVDSIGKSSFRFKVEAFAIGAVFAGIGGAFYAIYLTYISPDMFTAQVSVYVLAAVLISTRGSSIGAIGGITIVAFLLEGTRLLKDYITFVDGVELAALRLIVLGAGLMAVVLVRFSRTTGVGS